MNEICTLLGFVAGVIVGAVIAGAVVGGMALALLRKSDRNE